METITNYVTVAYQRMRLLSQLHERTGGRTSSWRCWPMSCVIPWRLIRNAVQYAAVLKGLNDPDVNWAREMIDRQVTNLVHLIDDLLEISRITRGKIQLHQQLISLSSVLSHAVEAVQPAISEKRQVLSLDFSATRCPSSEIRHALNRSSSTCSPMPPSTPTTGASLTSSPGEMATGQSSGSATRRSAYRRKCSGESCQPFAQVDQSLDRSKGGGLGIGLTLVKSLAEMHGGSVLAASADPGLERVHVAAAACGGEVAGPARMITNRCRSRSPSN